MHGDRRSPITLLVAAASSAAAAVVVREVWAPGTIPSAALTPVLVALFEELLHHPMQRVGSAARQRVARRSGGSDAAYLDRVFRARSRLWRALATGAAAFAVGGAVLTGAELVIDHSVAGRAGDTTLFGGPNALRNGSAFAAPRSRPTPVRTPTAARAATRRQGSADVRSRARAPRKQPARTKPVQQQGSSPTTTATTTTTTAPTTTGPSSSAPPQPGGTSPSSPTTTASTTTVTTTTGPSSSPPPPPGGTSG
jgi:hypothetical protein